MRIGDGELDLWRFEEALRRARQASSVNRATEAVAGYREAAALWRAPRVRRAPVADRLSS
ncbi:BTAD domain-containing putative transcriptional regulator [Dactylosporangium sp. NPDC000521]|uniref:BTAD domain-containing putative transcriptional regulator n=1 Tax=Dactylosporangium sp. NPDC000521 TaxID=3363975 RepID=UPI00369022C8